MDAIYDLMHSPHSPINQDEEEEPVIDNIEFEDIELDDYPDFVNAYIVSADKDGIPMTEREIDQLDDEFVHEKVTEFVFG